MRKSFLLIVLFCTVAVANAQELNCQVQVLTPRIQSSDKKIYTTLQQAIFEFINNTKWTGDKFQAEEKIECSIQIEVTERVTNDEFKGTIQVSSRRPVYKTSYNSPMINIKDDDFSFRYIELQNLEFNEASSNPNLVAVLAYYAYLILGVDYDSYSLMGGGPYFQKIQTIVANMQNASDKGWKSYESNNRNRYWLSENYNNPIYKPIRAMYFNYHRKGLDIMWEKKDDGLHTIGESIEGLKKVHSEKPISALMQSVFDAKADEVVNIFSGAPGDIKTTAKTTLDEVNPSNTGKYQKILLGNN